MITRENRSRFPQAAKGFVCIPRSAFDHPLWRTPREFTRTEALIDIYRLARSLPTEQLQRGEFQCTYQELADKWGWTRHRAQRFIKAREKDQTIIRLNRTGATAHVFAVTAWVEASQTPTKPPNERGSEHVPKPPKLCPVAAVAPVDAQDVEHETAADEQKKEPKKEKYRNSDTSKRGIVRNVPILKKRHPNTSRPFLPRLVWTGRTVTG